MQQTFFAEAKIDFELYQHLNESIIDKIFSGFPPGIILKFTLRYKAVNSAHAQISENSLVSSVSYLNGSCEFRAFNLGEKLLTSLFMKTLQEIMWKVHIWIPEKDFIYYK